MDATLEISCSNRTDRDTRITQHMSLVRIIAGNVQRSLPVHVDLDDLTHAGMLGLIDAADKYEESSAVVFAAYAKHRIRGAILDSMRQADWVSRDLRRRVKHLEAVRQSMSVRLGREAGDEEVAAELGLNGEEWQALMADVRLATNSAVSLAGEREENDGLVREVPCEPGERPDRIFAQAQASGKLASLIQTLPERYRAVLDGYYQRDLTMREIANELGVRESRISQIHKSALEILGRRLRQDGIGSSFALAA